MTGTAASPRSAAGVASGASRPWWALAVLSLAQMMIVVDTAIVTIALPSAQRDVGLSIVDRQWVVTAYTLAFGGLLMLGGRISDLLGRKRMLLIGAVGFALACTVSALAVNPAMLVSSRVVEGASAAILAPSTLSMLNVIFTEPRARAKAFGVYGAVLMSGVAVGMVVGGLVTELLGWRWARLVSLPIAATVLCVGLAVLPSVPRRRGVRLDVPGTLLGCGGMVALVYALGEAGKRGWTSALVLTVLGVAALLLVGFAVVQKVVADPLLPPRVVIDRHRAGAFLAIGVEVFGMLAMFVFMTYQLQAVMRYSPLTAGFAFLPYAAAAVIGSTQIGSRLLPRVPPRTIIVPGLFVVAVGMLLLTRLTPDASYATTVLPALVVLGLGVGTLVAPITSTATLGAGAQDAGVAAAFVNTSQQLGGSIGTALLNTIAAGSAATYVATHEPGPLVAAEATVHGNAVASAWAAGIIAVFAVVIAILIPARRAPAPAPPPAPPTRPAN